MENHSYPKGRNRKRAKDSFRWQRSYSALIVHWLPVMAWAAVIFFFSTDDFSSDTTSAVFGALFSWLFSGISAETLDIFHLMIRKLGHWSEYGIFAMLLLWALKTDSDKIWQWRHAGWTLAFILIYAIGDELHQSFVPSRTASAGDVLIDVFGGICGILWTYWYRKGMVVPLNGRANTTTA
jgi:VanZ family protein